MKLLEQLQEIPVDWGLVAVGKDKRPYQDDWQRNPLTHDQVAAEVCTGRARAVGVLAGPVSGGLLFVDFDGESAASEMERLILPASSLPTTVGFTSGKQGRFQLAFLVPEQYWDSMRGRRVFKTGKLDAAGKAENLDFRWTGHQSIVIGEHPETSGYRWLEGRSPSQVQVAEAPLAMIELMLREPEPEAKAPLLRLVLDGGGGAVPLLDFVTRGSRELVEGGGTPGSWNDDQLVLALDLVGTEAWLLQQGLQPDMTARDAFELHIQAARGKAKDFSERKAWQRFDGAAGRNPSPGTPEDKLLERVAYHTRPERGERRRESVPPGPSGPPEPPEPPGPLGPPAAGGDREPLDQIPITCLGFSGDDYFYQSGDSGQLTRITRSAHSSSTSLIGLADLSEWEQAFPRYNGEGEIIGVSWKQAVNDLFRRQHRVGIFDPDRIRGRGAWWDDGKSVLHLGDRMIIDGRVYPVTSQPASRYNYQRLAAIDLATDIQPLTDQQGAEILDIASRFLWEVPASGLLLAGWAALAPICGSLAWRPHLWLTASAGSGKSAILDRFLGTLLHELALWPEGSTTEASIRQELRADALPVIMDEAESNEESDRKRVQDILALARVASSSGRGFVGRGGADGAAQRFVARAMFLLCSISTALKQGADASRFTQLVLRNPSCLPLEQRQAHWEALDRDMAALITPELGQRMLLRSVKLIPIIRDSVAVFRRAAALRFDSQRQGDQYGTLLAGAWSLMNSRVATEADAYGLIDSNEWQAYKDAVEQSDEERCLAHILQHQLRVEVERTDVKGDKLFTRNLTITRTVWELVDAVSQGKDHGDVPVEDAISHLGRIGLRVKDGRLLISNTALGLKRILANTAWSHSWPTVLARLPGAEKPGKVRFRGIDSNSRAVSLPLPAPEDE